MAVKREELDTHVTVATHYPYGAMARLHQIALLMRRQDSTATSSSGRWNLGHGHPAPGTGAW